MTLDATRAAAFEEGARHSPSSGWRFGDSELNSGAGGRVRRWAYHRAVRGIMFLYTLALALARRLGRRPRRPFDGEGHEILLTGRFESGAWAAAHLRPLAASVACAHVRVVSTYPVPEIDKVVAIYPPRWLVHLAGDTVARLLVFGWTAVLRQPHVIGGFHIAFNALLAIVLAPLVRARSLYVSVGGPTEIVDGGVWSETKILVAMETPDAVVERRFLCAIRACDTVITMGTRAAEYLRRRGVETAIHVVSGGISAEEFRPSETPVSLDLILVGRLTETKRPHLFLQAIALVATKLPSVTAAVVGDGPLGSDLKALARELGISDRVTFAGFQPEVSLWLKRSRVFVLTSRSEGLSLAMMEAMMCGLPAVVSNVGDLGDLVEDGVSGYLVDEASPEAFADRIVAILSDRDKYAAFSHASRGAALRYETGATTHLWDAILTDLDGQRVAERG